MESSPSGPAPRPFLHVPPGSEGAVEPLPILGVLPRQEPLDEPGQMRIVLPLVLFVLACLSTFWAGSHGTWVWIPNAVKIGKLSLPSIRFLGLQWSDGLAYMCSVMGILLAHEMGHFIQALRYRVPASLPFFIPMPFTPIGTMGAVIGMQGSQADRKQLFDIGLTGPLAGLVVAIPLTWIGVMTAQPFDFQNNIPALHFQYPLLVKMLIAYLRPDVAPGQELNMNPFLMAGWVGMLITGINMLPVSQLDGGHVAYALFGKSARTLARLVLLSAIAYMVFTDNFGWFLMVMVVMLIGVDHPQTADDHVPLGWPRRVLGLLSLAIPILCLSPNPFSVAP